MSSFTKGWKSLVYVFHTYHHPWWLQLFQCISNPTNVWLVFFDHTCLHHVYNLDYKWCQFDIHSLMPIFFSIIHISLHIFNSWQIWSFLLFSKIHSTETKIPSKHFLYIGYYFGIWNSPFWTTQRTSTTTFFPNCSCYCPLNCTT